MTLEPEEDAVYATAAEKLAKRLERDMRERGIGPGDPYMTAVEAGRRLNVSRASADRAMAVLAERRLLVRRRVGSFGGPKLERPTVVGSPTVCVLTRAKLDAFDSVPTDDIVSGLRRGTGQIANIQFCSLPQANEANQVRETIALSQHTSGPFGVVARSCPPHVHECLIESGIPTVAIGGVYPGQEDLPSIDHDANQGGRILMQYLIAQGHKHMTALFIPVHLASQTQFLDGLHDAMSEAGLPPNALRVCTVSHDPINIATELEPLIAQPNRSTAIITMMKQIGMIASDVASAKGVSLPDDLEVVFDAGSDTQGRRDHVEHTQLQYAIGPREVFAHAGDMLRRLWKGLPLDQKQVSIPPILSKRPAR